MASNSYAKKEWSELKVGEGDVNKIPVYLKALAKPDCPRWDYIMELTSLYEKGKIFSAAAKAIPELVNLLTNDKTPDKDTILVLIASITSASHTSRVVWGIDFNRSDIKQFYVRGVAREVWNETWSHRDLYIKFLDDDDAMVRSAAAFLLAFNFSDAVTNQLLIEARVLVEANVKAKASLLLSLGMMQSYIAVNSKKNPTINFQKIADDISEDILVRGAAVIAQIYSSSELINLSPSNKTTLVEWCFLSEVDPDGYPWNNGVTDMHACRVVEGRCADGGLVAAEILAECIRRYGPLGRGNDWAGGILTLAFPDADNIKAVGSFLIDSDLYDVDRFSDRQRALLEVLSTYSFAAPFQSYGIPEKISDRRCWLGLEEPGPMEQVVEVEVLGKLRKWPVWKCMKMQYASKPYNPVDVEALLGKALNPTQLLEVQLEYSKMAYGLTWGSDDEVFEKVMEHSHEMLPYARKHLRYMSRIFNEFGAVHVNNGSKAAITAMHVLIKEGFVNEILPEDDVLLQPGTSAIYKHFDLARREKFILDHLKSCFLTDNSAFWYAKHNIHSALQSLEYFPTEKVANILFDLRDHILANFKEFYDVCNAIEAECQKYVSLDEAFAKVVEKRLNQST